MSLRVPGTVRRFAMIRSDVEAVLQRCGRETFDLVLIDVDGNWTRWVVPAREVAESAARELGIPLHDGWDARMSQRMNRRDHWNVPGGQKRAL